MGQITSVSVRKDVDAAAVELDKRLLLQDIGIDPDGSAELAQMVPDDNYYALLEMLDEAEVGPTRFQICAGGSMRCSDYGAFDMACKAATTLRGTYERAERYARLFTSVSTYED